MPKTFGKKDPDIVALASPDGSLNAIIEQTRYVFRGPASARRLGRGDWADGNWYFPSTVLTKIPKNLDIEDDVEEVITKIAHRASKYKKVQAKKLVKSNKSKKPFS